MLIKNKRTKFIDQVDYENIRGGVYYYKDDNVNLIRQNYNRYKPEPIQYFKDDESFYGGVDEVLADISKQFISNREERDILDEKVETHKKERISENKSTKINDESDNCEFAITPIDNIEQPAQKITNTFTAKRDILSSIKGRLEKFKNGGKENTDKLYSIKEVVNTFIYKIYL